MTNEPGWEDIFASPQGEPPTDESAAPTTPPTTPPAAPANAAVPRTRRELREAERRAAALSSEPASAGEPAVGAPVAAVPVAAVPVQHDPLSAFLPVPSRAPESQAEAGGGPPPSPRAEKPQRRKRKLAWLWVLLAFLLVVGGAGAYGWVNYEPQIRKVLGWELPIDYASGTASSTTVTVVIVSGDVGSDIARALHEAGVTMTAQAFYDLLVTQDPAPTFQPGTYTLHKHLSAREALAELQDPANRVMSMAVIPEGLSLASTLQRLADATEIPLADFQAAAAQFTTFGVPAEAPSLEGYLFPATYTFEPPLAAQTILQTMVDRMYQSLDAAGVAPDDRYRVLTLAALIQKEGGSTEDFYKVSRVFQNRIEAGMLLQSDATVSYGTGNTSIHTTAAERADASNLYNTYANPGLPIGPICMPGDDAIDAALHPAQGDWLYFVLMNGETGETAFSNTLEEHNAAVKVWQKWYRDHPGWDN